MTRARTRTVLWSLIAILLSSWSTTARAQGEQRQVDLRPRFKAGQQTRFKMETTNSTQVAGKTQVPRTQSKAEFGIALKTKSVNPEGQATVDLIFESLKVSSTSEEGKIEFDSAKPAKGGDEDIVGSLLQSLVGSTLTLTVDKSGSITNISGGESFSALGQFVGGGGNGGALFGPLFSVKKGTGLVRVGESWEDEDQIDNALLGQFTMKTTHTLKSHLMNEAKVDMVGRITPRTEGTSSGAGSLKNSSYSGSYLWDTERGMLKKLDSTMKVKMQRQAGGVSEETSSESVVRVTQVH